MTTSLYSHKITATIYVHITGTYTVSGICFMNTEKQKNYMVTDTILQHIHSPPDQEKSRKSYQVVQSEYKDGASCLCMVPPTFLSGAVKERF